MSRPKTRPIYFIVILLLLLSACSAAAAPTPQPSYEERQAVKSDYARGAAPPAPAMEAPAAPVLGESAPPAQANTGTSQSVERIVIKNGSLTIVVADPPKSMDAIVKLAEDMGGYVVTSNMYKETIASGAEVPRGSVAIRVPAERMLEAMQLIKAQSSQDPLNENTSSQDVTSEYVDLQSRLKNLEAAEADLTRIMNDAQRTEDVLSVYTQLTQIREQIEVIKGQIKYYEQSAALSAISVELIADRAIQPIEIGGWQPQGAIKKAIEALIKTMQGLVELIIWLVIYLLPVLLALGIIFVLPPALIIYFLVKRQRRKKALAILPAAQPPVDGPAADE